MNYRWARDFTLALINRYTAAGVEIPAGYNDQGDCLKRIPALLDSAQLCAATTTGKIRAVTALSSLSRSSLGRWWLYRLPEDCWQVCSGGLVRYDGPVLQRYHRYRAIGDNGIAVPKTLDGELMLEYYRYPLSLGDDPKEDTLLDNTREVQMALPYYAAAHLVMQDNAFAYQALYNEFEVRLARVGEQLQTEVNVVEDSYSADEYLHNG